MKGLTLIWVQTVCKGYQQMTKVVASKKRVNHINLWINGLSQKVELKTDSNYLHLSRDMRFPTMWYVRPAKAQTSLRIRAV